MKTRLHHFREPIGVALETLRAHKMRSFLMLLGIVLSVSTLIMVVALISGVNLYVANRIANLGSNVFLVLRFPIITDMDELVKATRRNKPITWDDYVFLRDNSKLALRVGAQANLLGRTKANGQTVEDTTIYGVTANIGDMKTEGPASGRYITDTDNQHRSLVALIGTDIADKLFPGVDPDRQGTRCGRAPLRSGGSRKTDRHGAGPDAGQLRLHSDRDVDEVLRHEHDQPGDQRANARRATGCRARKRNRKC